MKKKILILLLASTSVQLHASSLHEENGFLGDSNVSFNIKEIKKDVNAEVLPDSRGSSIFDYYAVDGVNFLGRTSAFNGGDGFDGERSCNNGSTERFVDHELKMGPNDLLDGFRVWGDDVDASEDLAIIIYRACLPLYNADSVFSEVILNETMVTSAGDSSEFFNTNNTFKGLEYNCKVMMRIRFGLPATCNGIQDISFNKIRIQLRPDELIYKDSFSEY